MYALTVQSFWVFQVVAFNWTPIACIQSLLSVILHHLVHLGEEFHLTKSSDIMAFSLKIGFHRRVIWGNTFIIQANNSSRFDVVIVSLRFRLVIGLHCTQCTQIFILLCGWTEQVNSPIVMSQYLQFNFTVKWTFMI